MTQKKMLANNVMILKH